MPPAVMSPSTESPVRAGPGKDWNATFPSTFDRKEESDLFMSRCLYVAFSHILESRRLVPPEVFKKRTIEDVVKTYVMNLKHPLGLRIANKFRGAGEAIKAGYMDTFVLVISENRDNPDDAIEVYTWKMNYNEDGTCTASLSSRDQEALANISYNGPESVRKQTRALLQRVRYVCRSLLGQLPEDVCPSFRITYTKNAPKGYQAEGFKPHPKKEIYSLDERAKDVNVCGVATAHGKMLLSIKSIYIDDEYTFCCRLNEVDDSENGDVSLLNQTVTNDSFMNDSIEQARLDGMDSSSESVSSARTRRGQKRALNKLDESSLVSDKTPEPVRPTKRGPPKKAGRNLKDKSPMATTPGYVTDVRALSAESSPVK
ncbi:unnamed protein product [Auanema sp. JU1783]|nr:unnamed protein product [Auanema sp. JU1783]